MPGNGIAAAAQITAALPDVAVVMLTVSRQDEDLFDALARLDPWNHHEALLRFLRVDADAAQRIEIELDRVARRAARSADAGDDPIAHTLEAQGPLVASTARDDA